MDFELWIRLGRAFPAVHVLEYWAAFRIHPESKSVAQLDLFWAEMRSISRASGGAFFSGHRKSHLIRRYPNAGRLALRAAAGARMLRTHGLGAVIVARPDRDRA